MNVQFQERTRWALVMAFAIAMAWVEAASVFYIRALVDRIEPYQTDPLPQGAMRGALGTVELWREAATLVMIATLGVLAGRTWRHRAGYGRPGPTAQGLTRLEEFLRHVFGSLA